MAIAKRNVWKEWSRELNTAEGRQKKFKLAEQIRNDKSRNTLHKRRKWKERWKKYFETLLNDENDNELEEESLVEGLIQEVTEGDVNKALKGMRNNKAPGPIWTDK